MPIGKTSSKQQQTLLHPFQAPELPHGTKINRLEKPAADITPQQQKSKSHAPSFTKPNTMAPGQLLVLPLTRLLQTITFIIYFTKKNKNYYTASTPNLTPSTTHSQAPPSTHHRSLHTHSPFYCILHVSQPTRHIFVLELLFFCVAQ
jgi:hypothetical protein